MPILGVIFALISFVLAVFPCSASAAPAAQAQASARFDRIVDDSFDFYFKAHPTEGTEAGFHQFDDSLEDASRSAVEAKIKGLVRFRTEFGKVDSSQMPELEH